MKTFKHLFAALMLLCSVVVNAHSFEVDGIYYNITNTTNKTVEVTYKGSSSSEYSNEYTGNVVIPESVTYNETTYSVASIGNYAFYACSRLTNIIIPNSVTSIGYEAFYNCNGLTSIKIPNSVTSIGYETFYNCSGLTSIEIPNSVTSIGNYAFYNCSGLTSATIGNSVTSIGIYAFNGCSGLTSINIPNSVTNIGNSAFNGCSGLTSMAVASGNTVYDSRDNCNAIIETVTNTLFAGCKNTIIPNNVTTIGSNAFYRCSGLTSVTIPNSVTTIGSSAFYGCSGLTSINIPNSVTNIGNSAFNGCSGLTSINIPNSVTNIGNSAFNGCLGLTSITIGNSVTSIGEYAFSSCNLDYIYMSGTNPPAINSNSFYNINNSAVIVPDAALNNYRTADVWSDFASRITSNSKYNVVVNATAEYNTSGVLNVIGVDEVANVVNIKVIGTINSYDVILFRDKMPLLKTLDLSETKVVANSHAFFEGNCTSANNLGAYTFNGLSKLCSVKLPKDLVAIESSMFKNCISLHELEIPESVQYIGSNAFYYCSALKAVKMPKEMNSIGQSAFYNCSSLKEITIPKGIKSLPYHWDGLFESCSSLEKVILPDSLEEIGGGSFYYCSKLKEIKLPPTIRTIGEKAFYGCSSLEEIRIPSAVKSIGSEAFSGCSKLQKVYTYTVEPTIITETTFSTFGTATLYIPSFSFWNYYWDEDGWKRFLNLADFNEPYEYFYINNDYILNDDTGYIEGANGNAPDADINTNGGFIVEGEQGDDEEPNQNLGDVNVDCDGNGNSGTIIGDNNLHIDDLHIRISVRGGRWYFFAFPFDIFFKDIKMQNGSDYVFRYYDGEERGNNGKGGWKDIEENHLKAARGYIFQCSANDVLILSIKDVKFKKEDKYNELVAHVSENLKDASWNYVGNPYLSYYDIADMDYSAPVTVWDGEKYIAIRPGDDDYHFAPYEAFFVQKPVDQEAIGFEGDKQMTNNQSKDKKNQQNAARRTRGINNERLLINLTISDGTTTDRTRVVFNEKQSLAYETACDASKFETNGVVQIYTIGNDGTHYAINERPADNGRVVVGYTVPASGLFTIEAERMDVQVVLVDTKNGITHDLNEGAYTFSSNAGTFNERFEIKLNNYVGGATAIDEVEENSENAEKVYDLQGRKMERAEKGIYIVNGEKVIK